MSLIDRVYCQTCGADLTFENLRCGNFKDNTYETTRECPKCGAIQKGTLTIPTPEDLVVPDVVDRAAISEVAQKVRNTVGYIVLDPLPNNCGECPCFQSYFDEEAGWGDNMLHKCPFNSNLFGCYVERPDGCPIKVGGL